MTEEMKDKLTGGWKCKGIWNKEIELRTWNQGKKKLAVVASYFPEK
jgi:hypothetical protein